MAGYSRMYVLGGAGGFMGSDGVNPIEVLILQGEGSRQWLEPRYLEKPVGPIGSVRSLVPAGPGDPDAVIDACIAFCPDYFRACPSLPEVEKALAKTEQLDFNAYPKRIPAAWARLREEARPIFAELGIWTADFVPLERNQVTIPS